METKNQLLELEELVSLGLKEGYRKMVEFKKKNNSPLIVSKDGKVVAIPPDQIQPTTSEEKESKI